MLSEGDKVPALKTRLSDGMELDLSATGRPVVLYFYPKDHNGSDAVGKPIASGTAL